MITFQQITNHAFPVRPMTHNDKDMKQRFNVD